MVSSFFGDKFHLLQQLFNFFWSRVVKNFVDNRSAQFVELLDLYRLAANAPCEQLVRRVRGQVTGINSAEPFSTEFFPNL